MTVDSFIRNGVLASGLVVVIMGIYFSCAWGVAYVADYMVTVQMEAWVTGRSIPDRNKWQQVHETMKLVLTLESDNADYQSDMAELYQYKASYLTVGASKTEALMHDSLQHFRKAALLRPAWPNAWAHIALVKSRMNNLDKEFYHAFDRAVLLGPAVPLVQYLISFAVFSNWQTLTQPYREKAIANAVHGLRNKKGKDIMAMLIQYDLVKLVCVASPLPDLAKYYCKKTAKE